MDWILLPSEMFSRGADIIAEEVVESLVCRRKVDTSVSVGYQ